MGMPLLVACLRIWILRCCYGEDHFQKWEGPSVSHHGWSPWLALGYYVCISLNMSKKQRAKSCISIHVRLEYLAIDETWSHPTWLGLLLYYQPYLQSVHSLSCQYFCTTPACVVTDLLDQTIYLFLKKRKTRIIHQSWYFEMDCLAKQPFGVRSWK